jgi:hypothetical protein
VEQQLDTGFLRPGPAERAGALAIGAVALVGRPSLLDESPAPHLGGAYFVRVVVRPRGNERRDFIDPLQVSPALCNRLWYCVCGFAVHRQACAP